MSVDSGRARCHVCGRLMRGPVCLVCDSPSAGRSEPHHRPEWPIVWLRLHRRLLAASLLVLVGLAVVSVLDQHVLASIAGHAASPPTRRAVTRVADAPGSSPRSPVVAVNVPTSDWDSPPGPPGFAFAVRVGAGSTTLVTDYHLLVSAYLGGERSVVLALDGRVVSGRIVAVSPEPHVARIVVAATLPVLTVARSRPRPGDLLTVGVPTTPPVAGRVISYAGPGGRAHLVFTADVAARLAGAPVLDSAGQVVGVAEPTDQFPGAVGIGFAVPIDTACAAVGC